MARIFVSAVLLTALSGGMAACHEDTTPRKPPRPAPTSSTDTEADRLNACGADKVAEFIGRSDDPAMREQLRQRVGSVPIRWIRPGEAVTQDFAPNRLNVIFDQTGRVRALRCG